MLLMKRISMNIFGKVFIKNICKSGEGDILTEYTQNVFELSIKVRYQIFYK